MNLKEIFLEQFNNLDKSLIRENNLYNNQIILVINNFKNSIIDQTKQLFNNDIGFLINTLNETTDSITEIGQNINNNTNENIIEIHNQIKNLSNFVLNNSILTIEEYSKIVLSYKEKINNIEDINHKYIDTINSIIELFIYRITINYNLKDHPEDYSQFRNITNNNKKLLIENLKKIISTKKDSTLLLFETCTLKVSNDILNYKDEILIKNKKNIILYIRDNTKNKNTLLIKENLSNNCKSITNVLIEHHVDILNILKLKNNSSRKNQLRELNNYFISFCNNLYDKALHLLSENLIVLNFDFDVSIKQLKKYNDDIYKLCEIEYSFERQLYYYSKLVLSDSLLSIDGKIKEEVKKSIKEEEKQIIDIIKLSLINMLKDSYNYLNDSVYKIKMLDEKLNINLKELNYKEIKELFN